MMPINILADQITNLYNGKPQPPTLRSDNAVLHLTPIIWIPRSSRGSRADIFLSFDLDLEQTVDEAVISQNVV